MDEKLEPGEHWLAIEDFSPGCYSQGGAVVGNATDRLLGAPLGAADAENTFSCYALPNNNLAALPGITQTYAFPGTVNPGAGANYIVGLLIHDELADGTTEGIVILEYDTGASHSWSAYSYILETNTLTAIVNTTNTGIGPGLFGSPYPQFTRVANAFLISAVAVGATTTFTTSFVSVANPFSVGQTFYFDELPKGVTGLALNTPYLVTAVGGASGAWTFTIATPTTGGAYTSGGGATILEIPYGPVAVFPSGGQAQAAQGGTVGGQLYMYPNPAARSVYGAFPMMANPGASITGQTLVHQSRILVLAGVNYTYPAGGGFDTNENINFTDPPLSASMDNQQTVLAAEEPYGYGCGGSISAGELFLVKKRGGGVIVTGDIVSPTVTILPGVQSTGNIYGNAASTPAGFIYCSYDNGAWLWNGSNTSRKISQNLDNGFFLPNEFAGTGGAPFIASNNYGFYVNTYGDQVFFSNNWMYDTRNGAWWTYTPRKAQGGHDLFWWQPVNGNFIYAGQLSFPGSNVNFMYRFDPATAAQTYQWQSLPLKLESPDHVMDIREVAIMTGCSTAGTSINISILDNGSVVWGPQAMSGTIAQSQTIRYNTAAIGTTNPVFRVIATGAGGDMPIIKSIKIRYNVRARVGVNN